MTALPGTSPDNPLYVSQNANVLPGTSGIEFPEGGRIWGMHTNYTVVNDHAGIAPEIAAPKSLGFWRRTLNRWIY